MEIKTIKIKTILILFVAGFIGYQIATFDYVEYKRNSILKDMQAKADSLSGSIAEEKKSLQEKLNALIQTEQCIKANSETGKVVDCKNLSFSGVEVIIEYSTSSILPSKDKDNKLSKKELKLIEEERKIEESKKQHYGGVYLPESLFYVYKASDNCFVTQNEQQHFTKKGGYMLATDVACDFDKDGKVDKAEVYAPDYMNKQEVYTLYKKKDNLLGDYVELVFDDKKWVLGHTTSRIKDGTIVHTGERIGQSNLTGYTTGYHTHIELWALIDGQRKNISYTTRSKVLNNKRNGILDNTVKKGDKIYFTSYNIGDVNQNDNSPFIGASGRNLLDLIKKGEKVIALTEDVRKLYGIKFGDVIQLNGKCSGKYRVEDEMNMRYRYSCITKDGACIKGDIAILQQEEPKCSGLYTISK